MDADKVRIARNESLRRDVNEAIDAGRRTREGRVGFICECGQLGCSRIVELTLSDYEQLRDHPRRFVVVDGHEQPAAEVVVERHEGHLVVEKRGVAGDVAEQHDPRS